MAYIEIDLGEVDFDDLIEEMIDRIKIEKPYSPKESGLIKKLCKEIWDQPGMVEVDNLADEMKMKYLLELREKYTEQQLRDMVIAFSESNSYKIK